jgi:hypothetical protein
VDGEEKPTDLWLTNILVTAVMVCSVALLATLPVLSARDRSDAVISAR